MKQIFLLFSHQLTITQQDELKNSFDVGKFIYLPPELQNIWSNILPELPSIKNYLQDIFVWLKENSNFQDLVLVQGEFGAVFLTVDFCKKAGLIPIYATAKRVITEEIVSDQTVQTKRNFTHVRFREFEKWSYRQ